MKQKINDVFYAYEWLTARKPNQPTLVCLHGFTGTKATFRFFEEYSFSYNLLAIDLPGHGQTDSYIHPFRYQMANVSQDLLELLTFLKIDSFSLLGYSMGARLALFLACQYPKKVNQLILEGGSPGLSMQKERQLRQWADQRLATFIVSHSLTEFVDYWQTIPLFQSQQDMPLSQQEAIRNERLSQVKFGLACSLWYMGTGVQPDLWPNLKQLQQIPTLLLVGELDQKFRKIAESMQNRQSTLEMEVVSEAGHCVHVERPEKFAEIVRSWLEGENNKNYQN